MIPEEEEADYAKWFASLPEYDWSEPQKRLLMPIDEGKRLLKLADKLLAKYEPKKP